jgi:hypothetical protein
MRARCTQATGKVADLQTELDKARKRAEQSEKALQQLRQSLASPPAHTPTPTPTPANQNQTSLPVARSSSGGTQRPLASPVSGAPPVAAGGAGFNAGNRVCPKGFHLLIMYCMRD